MLKIEEFRVCENEKAIVDKDLFKIIKKQVEETDF